MAESSKLSKKQYKFEHLSEERTTGASIRDKLSRILRDVKDNSNEEQVKKDFVFPLCRLAGWKVDAADSNDPKTSIEVEKYQPQRGRLDLVLKDEAIPRIVIECKRPEVVLVQSNHITSDGMSAMEQAHRYARGVRFWRNRCLPNIMSMVTNGRQVIFFDSSVQKFEEAYRTAKPVEITEKSIIMIRNAINLEKVRNTDLKYICKTSTISDERKAIESSSTHLLTKIVLQWLKEIRRAKKITKYDALDMTLQLLFLTIARDHGILGSEELAEDFGSSNWDAIFKKCHKRFNSNVFETPRPTCLSPEVLDKLYENSKTLGFSLEAIPVEYVGDIYEKMLHTLHAAEAHLSKTSYFTPPWLIRDIIEELKPTADEAVIDPTCGSGAFLCDVFDCVTKNMDFKEARNYLSSKIFGVDCDPLAVQVSRFALLVCLSRKVHGDWKEKEHILPKLTKHIVAEDFFLFQTNQKFDVALGNPPWGSIDREVRNKEIKNSLKSYECYNDKTDVSIYVVERAFRLLSQNGRLGFLVQRSAVDGVQHGNFRKWWDGKIEKVWDFGADELFSPRNAALTAVVLGRATHADVPTKIVSKASVAKSPIPQVQGISFNTWFRCLKGAEAAHNDIYELYAESHLQDPLVRSVIGPKVIRNGTIASTRRALFLHPKLKDKEIPKRVLKWLKRTKLIAKLRGKQKKVERSCYWWLKNRAECPRLVWKRLNGYKYYQFDVGQKRIVFPYYLNGPRLMAGLDNEGSMIPLTSTTVLIPKTANATMRWWVELWQAEKSPKKKENLGDFSGAARRLGVSYADLQIWFAKEELRDLLPTDLQEKLRASLPSDLQERLNHEEGRKRKTRSSFLTDEHVYFTLGWLNSSQFSNTEAQTKGKLSAKGGRALYRDYVATMLIPDVPDEIFNKVIEIMRNVPPEGLSSHDLNELDDLFEKALHRKS